MKLYKAKKVYTVDSEFSVADAIVVDGKSIVEVGTVNELESKYPELEVSTKYADKYIYPGLIEPHTHVFYSKLLFGATSFVDVIEWNFGKFGKTKAITSKEALFEAIRHEVRTSEDQKLYFWGYYIPIHELITRHDLDALLKEENSNKDIYIFTRSIHGVLMSTKAMQELKLDEKFGTEEAKKTFGLGLTEDNELSGMFAEQALISVLPLLMKEMVNPEKMAKGQELYIEQCRINGVVSVVDFATGTMLHNYDGELAAVANLRTEEYPMLPASLLMYQIGNEMAGYDDEKTYELINSYVEKYSNPEDGMKVLKGIKFFFDGAILDGQIQAYQSDEENCDCPICRTHVHNWQHEFGPKNIDTLVSDLTPYWQNDYSIYCHSQGDESQDRMLSTLEALYENDPKEGYEFVVQHFGFHGDDFIERLKASKVTPNISALVWYIEFYQAWKDYKMFPNKLLETICDFKAAVDAGMKLSMHGDSPSNPTMPLHAFRAIVTRQTRDGQIVYAERGIDRITALRGITSEAARQVQLDGVLGSLEAGKYASFIALDNDIIEDDLLAIKPTELAPSGLVVEGKEIY